MVAGVARCMAPGSGVYVGSHFPYSGGTLEYMLARDLETLIADQSPDLINLSTGGYTGGDVPPLSFIEFRRRHAGVTLVTAAGNDSTDRPFWPAAFDWAVAVGALGAAAARKPLRPGLQDEPLDGERHAEVQQRERSGAERWRPRETGISAVRC